MTSEFGKSYNKSNLRNMHSRYSTITIQDALRPELRRIDILKESFYFTLKQDNIPPIVA